MQSPADLAALSRLLEEAFDLAPQEVEPWLDALPDGTRRLAPQLREMLSRRRSTGHAEFLAAGPRVSQGHDESIARADDLVGPYRLIRELGRGGMGSVWLAQRADGALKRQIALKLPRLAWGAGLAERMERERDIGALLEHPAIARLYDAGVDSLGRPFLALEYIDGVALDDWCDSRAAPLRERLRLIVQVTRAVAYAHGRLIVHRDLKPSNVLVTADGHAHLLDFGIAKLLDEAASSSSRLTQEQGRVMTPHYASPEQIEGSAVTVTSDVYSLGALLYELVTGLHPHEPVHDGLGALQVAILETEPRPASARVSDPAKRKALWGELDAILARALKRDPAQRYPTADALADDIERHLNGERVLAQPDSLRYRLGKTLHRHRVGFAVAGLVILAIIGGLAGMTVQARRAAAAAERARVVKEFVVDVFKINTSGLGDSPELRKLPAEMLLDHGAAQIEQKFGNQPELEAELFGVVGGIFMDMSDFAKAEKYARAQVEVLGRMHAPASVQVPALMLLSRALQDEEKLSDAEAIARRAMALADQPGLHADAAILLAAILHDEGNEQQTLEMLDRADREMSALSGPLAARAHSKFLRARLLNYANHFDLARPLADAAIKEALAAEGALSPSASYYRLWLAARLITHDLYAQSGSYAQAGLAAQRASGGFGDILAAQNEADYVDAAFGVNGPDFESTRDTLQRDLAVIAARGPYAPAVSRAQVEFDLADVYLTYGSIRLAAPLIARSVPILRKSFNSPGNIVYAANMQAMLAIYEGDHDAADRFLREGLDLQTRAGGAQIPLAASQHANLAWNLAMAGRIVDADASLALAPHFDGLKGGGALAQGYATVLQRARARIRLMAGDPAAALALLEHVGGGESSSAVDPFAPKPLRAEALCASGAYEQGLGLWNDLLKSFDARWSYAHNPDWARARALAGLCALQAGHRAQAAELSALASAAFLDQPGLAAYFREPSERLARSLARRPLPSADADAGVRCGNVSALPCRS